MNRSRYVSLARCLGLWFLAISTCATVSVAEMAIRYEVALEGTSEKEILSGLKAVSEAIALKDRPPATPALLERRAEEDIPRFQQALRAGGYYDAAVSLDIDEKKVPVLVSFRIEPGPVYRLESVEVKLVGEDEAARKQLPLPEDLGLRKGDPGRAAPIVDAQGKIVRKLRSKGYPFARTDEKRVVVDHATKGLSVTYLVEPGPPGRFGATTFDGLKSVKDEFLQGNISWHRGQEFNGDLIAELQERLTKTGLFSVVRITHAGSLEDDGTLPITVTVKERKHRTVSAGARYYTDEGPGVQFSWEHRNLFHGGESLKIDATASFIEYSGQASFKKPGFSRDDQTLLIGSRLASDETDAYTSRNMDSTVVVERAFDKTLQIGLGPGFRLSRVENEIEERQDFGLVSLASYLNWDTTDNLLDPTLGGRLNVKLNPYADLLDTHVTFLKGFASYSRYLKLTDRPHMVLATRAALGLTSGADRDSIPADLRFYSGGGGSVRGYAFQTLGPLEDGEPVGGASLLELNTELRFKVTERIGLAAFLDGGTSFEAPYPDFAESVRWGGGAGVRYYTPFGPLRLDVGLPLNKRPGVDDDFQIYLSLGQAF
jgi:translocation and assembly module TamA